ncbi:hypothetical protein [Actinoplanes teichomyceticus]|uniref:Uncharacterized protein n=1 Tax=Actinoplanes teichomyceticus TaxID=1867 RepID=A0A561WQN8_ACTTI|nr:hypothetical protein [Actinoplanes teichomyceticus]TWG26180.1 hypothetical protein FHX34_1011158 [Actinoplanes teichomyceticus]GIF11258.1 hypothetical protein Ate01nite_12900 [Actinoplanes teichomyceticus]
MNKRGMAISLASLVVSGALVSAVAPTAAFAGEADFCSTTATNAGSTWFNGTTRTTKQAEDIFWAYDGQIPGGCSFGEFYQPSDITARVVVNGSATSAYTYAGETYGRHKFTTQTANGASYKLQWRYSSTPTWGKWHFEN